MHSQQRLLFCPCFEPRAFYLLNYFALREWKNRFFELVRSRIRIGCPNSFNFASALSLIVSRVCLSFTIRPICSSLTARTWSDSARAASQVAPGVLSAPVHAAGGICWCKPRDHAGSAAAATDDAGSLPPPCGGQ